MIDVSIPYKRTDETGWWLDWIENGKPESIGFDTKWEATEYRKHLLKKLNRKDNERNSARLCYVMDEFRAFNSMNDVPEEANLRYELLFNYLWCFVPWVNETSRIDSVSVYEFVTEHLKTHDSYTVKISLECLKAFVKWLDENGYKVGRIFWPTIDTAKLRQNNFDIEVEEKTQAPTCNQAAEKDDINEITTLTQFLESNCGADKIEGVRARNNIKQACKDKKISLPKTVNQWRRGKTKLFLASDLRKNWSQYRIAIPTLPSLKK